jgi:hypothetical protein
MFCPQCGHRQVSDETRFCSRCGLSLNLVIELLANSPGQLQREKRELTGIGLMWGAVLMLTNFIIVFGAVTLPHLANPVFFWVWLGFVLSSLIVGGFGLANLIRGGFFKRLKEREARLRLEAERQRPALPLEEGRAEPATLLAERPSVTENTTRLLDKEPVRRP